MRHLLRHIVRDDLLEVWRDPAGTVSIVEVPLAAGWIGRPVRAVATHVVRWGGALPQYAVGHAASMSEVQEDVAAVPGLAICGAMLDGIGIPACAAAARAAAARVVRGLAHGWERMEA